MKRMLSTLVIKRKGGYEKLGEDFAENERIEEDVESDEG